MARLRLVLLIAGALIVGGGAALLLMQGGQANWTNGLVTMKAGAIVIGLGLLAPQPDRD